MMYFIMQIKDFCRGMFTKTYPDRSKISAEQIKIMCTMWAAWKENPSAYPTQSAFVAAVNARLRLHKSPTTIIRHIRANINATIQ